MYEYRLQLKSSESSDLKNNSKILEELCIPIKKKIYMNDLNYLIYDVIIDDSIITSADLDLLKYLFTIRKQEPVNKDTNIYEIYCDASMTSISEERIGLASTSNIILKNNNVIYEQNTLVNNCLDNNQAEVLAGNMAFNYIMNNNLNNGKNIFIIYTDSQLFQEFLLYNESILNEIIKKCESRKPRNKYEVPEFLSYPMRNILIDLKNFKRLPNLNVYVSWIKGHQEVITNKNIFFNNKCDYYAKKTINNKLDKLGLTDYKFTSII